MATAQRRGLSFKTTMGNILTLTPALVLSRAELDSALAILEEVLCYLPKHAHAKSSAHHLLYQETERWRSSKNGNL